MAMTEKSVPANGLVSEEDLARARVDAAFRQKLMAESLDRLLGLLNEMRRMSEDDPVRAAQLREGVDLAVKLADRLQTEDKGPRAA
jgi:hypothetical protein